MLKHKFTSREKVLLVMLALLLLSLLYKVVVFDYVENSVSEAVQNMNIAEDQYKIESTKYKNLEEMRKVLGKLENGGIVSEIPKYDNLSNIIVFMDEVLSQTRDYNLNFGKISTSGSIVRRVISLSFTASDYERAVEILLEIYSGKYRCSIGDVTVTPINSIGDITGGNVSVKMTVIFVEMKA